MTTMIDERLFNVLLSPLNTEKASYLDGHNKCVFKVANKADKTLIKKAVEALFQVVVTSVRIVNVKPKQKKFGRTIGWRKGWKKAYVTLQAGQVLKLMDDVRN